FGVLIALVAGLYAIGYSIAVFRRRGTWMESAQQANVGMCWVVVACVIVVHTPLLDPLTLSANNQFGRLVQEKVDALEFDYGFMRFRLGHVGYSKLGEMEQLTEHSQASIIRERVAATRAVETYREILAQPTILLTMEDIEVLYPEHILPEGLVDFMAGDITRNQTSDCKEEGDCLIAPVALDDDNEFEYLLVLSGLDEYVILAYDQTSEGDWIRVGRMRPVGQDAELPNRPAFVDTLSVQGAVPIEVPWRDLQIGGILLRLQERRQ
ncbi:MAG: hypothetical protein JSW51_11485, partial [Gemmatimonadota bacterium]